MNAAPRQPEPTPDDPSHLEQARRIFVVVRRGLMGLYRTGITRMGAALAYRTIFSIIPTIAIGLLIFGSMVSEEQVDAGVRRLLGYAGVSQIAVDERYVEDPPMGPLPEGAEYPDAPAEDEVSAPELDEIITDLVVRVNATLKNLPMGWIALVTGVVLLYAALSMLIEVEKSFNMVCHAPGARSWLRRLLLYWTMLTLGGVLLAATFWAGDTLTDLVAGGGASSFRSLLAGYGVSVLISTVLLTVAYLAIPTVRLRLRSVLAGAFLAAVVWELGKFGFTSYLKYSSGYARFYGSLALLPLFMLWVYVTWIIVLLGLQAAYALEHFAQLLESLESTEDEGPRVVDPATAVSIAGAVVRAHRDGRTPDAGEVGRRLAVDAAVVDLLLRRLERAGLVRRVVAESGDEAVGWLPARPAEAIPVEEVLDAVGDLEAARTANECGELLCDLEEARRAAVRGKTLADAVPGAAPSPTRAEPRPDDTDC